MRVDLDGEMMAGVVGLSVVLTAGGLTFFSVSILAALVVDFVGALVMDLADLILETMVTMALDDMIGTLHCK